MIHRARGFNLTDATIDQIAQTLHARTQTLCTGFRVTGAERSAEGAGRACPAAASIEIGRETQCFSSGISLSPDSAALAIHPVMLY